MVTLNTRPCGCPGADTICEVCALAEREYLCKFEPAGEDSADEDVDGPPYYVEYDCPGDYQIFPGVTQAQAEERAKAHDPRWQVFGKVWEWARDCYQRCY